MNLRILKLWQKKGRMLILVHYFCRKNYFNPLSFKTFILVHYPYNLVQNSLVVRFCLFSHFFDDATLDLISLSYLTFFSNMFFFKKIKNTIGLSNIFFWPEPKQYCHSFNIDFPIKRSYVTKKWHVREGKWHVVQRKRSQVKCHVVIKNREKRWNLIVESFWTKLYT